VSPCPPSWASYGAYCRLVATPGTPVPALKISDLAHTTLHGESTNGIDKTILTVNGVSYLNNNPSVFSSPSDIWAEVDFNIYGTGNGSNINFNTGSALTIKTSANYGSALVPSCGIGFPVSTLETNNLNRSNNCCSYGGVDTSIIFTESTNSDPTTTCASYGYTVTPSAGSGGSINPDSAFMVLSGKAAKFTITSNSGYTLVTPVGGTCGGTLSGNTYTTNPITTNCTVAATFTSIGGPSYTVTPSTPAGVGTGGTISPSGPVTVPSGNTAKFTVTANSGYSVNSSGGSCVGSWSAGTQSNSWIWTSVPITANCGVTFAFGTTVSTSAGTGGTISGGGTVVLGQTSKLTITPNSGYTIASVTGCGGTLSGNTYATGAITAPCTVTATFTSTVNTRTVGGSVSGLTGSGLRLALTAGNQTVNVSPDVSSYVFPTAVSSGTAYTVSVQTQPTGLTCSITNASGTVGATNVTNANVTCYTDICDWRNAISRTNSSSIYIRPGGLCLQSPNYWYIAKFQPDGNFVLYKYDSNTKDWTKVLWASNTYGKGADSLVMQSDWNNVIYSSSGAALWSTGTYGSVIPAGTSQMGMVMQDDGNLVVYVYDQSLKPIKALWATGTNGQ
jgi:hypothetical protein